MCEWLLKSRYGDVLLVQLDYVLFLSFLLHAAARISAHWHTLHISFHLLIWRRLLGQAQQAHTAGQVKKIRNFMPPDDWWCGPAKVFLLWNCWIAQNIHMIQNKYITAAADEENKWGRWEKKTKKSLQKIIYQIYITSRFYRRTNIFYTRCK